MEITGHRASYDELPYRALPATTSHPAHLAMVATLLGLRPTPVERARVLEIGCGTGLNLVPIAADLPGAELLGFDVAARQIEIGRQMLTDLGLRNITLQTLDLMDAGPSLGKFDYIIAHGLYSWVPAPVRDRLMALCREHLTEDGVACISYNTMPGWSFTRVLRDLMIFRTRGVADPTERAAEAQGILDLMVDGVTDRSEVLARFMRSYTVEYKAHLERLGTSRSSSLHHDVLAELNDPVYFHQFAEHAERHGLQYVTEASFQLSMPADMKQEVRESLSSISRSVIEMEQYLDFARMRMFRQSVLCHKDREINRSLTPERLSSLHIRASLRPASSRPDIEYTTVEKFLGPEGASLSTNHPVSKAALCHLAEIFPRSVPFPQLMQHARKVLAQAPTPEEEAEDAAVRSPDAQELARNLLRAFTQRRDLVTLRAHGTLLSEAVAERPLARQVARWEARHDQRVTNHYHESVELDSLQRSVLLQLDGTRDRIAVLSELVREAEAGKLQVERGGRAVQEPDQVRIILGRELDQALERLASLSLLSAG